MSLEMNIKIEKEPIELTDYCFKIIIKSEATERTLILNKLSCGKTEEDLLIKEEYHDEPFEFGCIDQDVNIHLHNKSVPESTSPLPKRALRRKLNVFLQASEKESTKIDLRKRKEINDAHDTDIG